MALDDLWQVVRLMDWGLPRLHSPRKLQIRVRGRISLLYSATRNRRMWITSYRCVSCQARNRQSITDRLFGDFAHRGGQEKRWLSKVPLVRGAT